MLTEEEGVKAMQFLLSMAGLTEPDKVSRRNWNDFSDAEKENTEKVYNSMKSYLN
jgi:hypothetical protein